MKIGITFDLREDYGVDRNSHVFADFCHPDEIGYMAEGIRANGYEPVLIGNMYHLNERIKSGNPGCDLVLVCDEGISSRNREAIVPALLEVNHIPWIGSDAYCMGLSQNKYHTKLVSEKLGIRCPRGIYVPFEEFPEGIEGAAAGVSAKRSDRALAGAAMAGSEGTVTGASAKRSERALAGAAMAGSEGAVTGASAERSEGAATGASADRTGGACAVWEEICDDVFRELKEADLAFPLIVKPNEEGYSMGVFLVKSAQELKQAVLYNFENYREGVLIEEFVSGQELYAPIIGTGRESYMLGIGVARYEDGSDIDIFSLDDKCFRTIRDEIPVLSPAAVEKIRDASLRLYRHMGCRDFGRCDFKLTKEDEPVLIEINPRPGLTQGGPFENCARAAGKTYAGVLGEIISSARKRYGI